MRTYLQSVENAYQKRRQFILIALTGRTGSGCSTAASILNTESFDALDLSTPKFKEFNSVDERKYSIVYKYMSNGHWHPFTIIEGSAVIFSFVIEQGFDTFKKFLQSYRDVSASNKVRISSFTDLDKRINGMSHLFDQADLCKTIDNIENSTDEQIEALYKFFITDLPQIKKEFQDILKNFFCIEETADRFSQIKDKKANLYTFFMQKIGNNIRSSGNPYNDAYSQDNYYQVANRINSVIGVIRKHNEMYNVEETRICIDAIRSPYEAFYFKDIYSSFYLVSVNTDEEERKRRLGYLDNEELESLDETEYYTKLKQGELFYHQNIPGCLEISDIHLYNPRYNTEKRYFLTEQIIRYLSLMIHPGLITPTGIERCMQLAYNAKLNSGCLSRQVGAIICDQHFSIKAVGWNDVPAGQVPCNLRDVCTFCKNMDQESYSAFEIEDPSFSESIHALNGRLKTVDLNSRLFPYCFKDVYEGVTGAKNQVHTRSLHAEENAFLQLSKYGGQGIEGGVLFTTASPCELCSKKAYQLGIRDIYYIDPYPGISFSHILKFGKQNNPQLHLFYGAIGSAYVTLYTQRLSLKDELELMTGLSAKKAKSYAQAADYHEIGIEDIQYSSRKTVLTFETREKISNVETAEIKVLHDNISEIPDVVFWTGSGFDSMSLQNFNSSNTERTCKYARIPHNTDPYISVLSVDPPFMKDEIFSVEKRIDVKDSLHVMYPYFAQMIMMRTDIADIEVHAKADIIKEVRAVIYADTDMNSRWKVSDEAIEPKTITVNNEEFKAYCFHIEKPSLKYSYCIEWSFV